MTDIEEQYAKMQRCVEETNRRMNERLMGEIRAIKLRQELEREAEAEGTDVP